MSPSGVAHISPCPRSTPLGLWCQYSAQKFAWQRKMSIVRLMMEKKNAKMKWAIMLAFSWGRFATPLFQPRKTGYLFSPNWILCPPPLPKKRYRDRWGSCGPVAGWAKHNGWLEPFTSGTSTLTGGGNWPPSPLFIWSSIGSGAVQGGFVGGHIFPYGPSPLEGVGGQTFGGQKGAGLAETKSNPCKLPSLNGDWWGSLGAGDERLVAESQLAAGLTKGGRRSGPNEGRTGFFL